MICVFFVGTTTTNSNQPKNKHTWTHWNGMQGTGVCLSSCFCWLMDVIASLVFFFLLLWSAWCESIFFFSLINSLLQFIPQPFLFSQCWRFHDLHNLSFPLPSSFFLCWWRKMKSKSNQKTKKWLSCVWNELCLLCRNNKTVKQSKNKTHMDTLEWHARNRCVSLSSSSSC